MSDRPLVVHIVGEYLFPYQSYVYRQLVELERFDVAVATKFEVAGARQQFPFPRIFALTRWGRLYGLLNKLDERIFDALFALYLKLFVLRHNVALFHIHNGALGARLAPFFRFFGVPVAVSFYGSDVFSYPLKLGWEKKYQKMFESQAHFIPLCESMKKELVKLGAKVGNNHVVHVVVNTEQFPFRERRFNGKVRFVTVARLIEKKGHFVLLEAFKKLVDSGLPVELEIVGFGDLKGKILERVEELGLKDNVTLTDPSGVGDYFSFLKKKLLNAHIFVLPSIVAKDADREGTPVVLMEAQASGMPVVASNLSGIPEVVVDGKSGFLVPSGDAAALAEKMIYLAQNPRLWPEMGRVGRAHIGKNYSQKILPSRLEVVYNEIVP